MEGKGVFGPDLARAPYDFPTTLHVPGANLLPKWRRLAKEIKPKDSGECCKRESIDKAPCSIIGVDLTRRRCRGGVGECEGGPKINGDRSTAKFLKHSNPTEGSPHCGD